MCVCFDKIRAQKEKKLCLPFVIMPWPQPTTVLIANITYMYGFAILFV